MQFRIAHLLAAVALVAFFAWGLSRPSETTVNCFKCAGWLASLVLIVRAMTHSGRERMIIAAGLLGSASYLMLLTWHVVQFPTSDFLDAINPQVQAKIVPSASGTTTLYYPTMGYGHFRIIGEFVAATLIGLLMAALAAFWTRSSAKG